MKIIKEYLNNFVGALGYKISRYGYKNYSISKLEKIKDPLKKNKKIQELIKLYPKDINLYYLQILCLNDLSDPYMFEAIKEYYFIKNKWLKESGIGEMNMEIVPYNIFYGALGNYYSLETLINANELGLRDKKKLIMFTNPNKKFTNQTLFNYFKKYLTLINLNDLTNYQDLILPFQEAQLGIFLDLKYEFLQMDLAHNRCQTEAKKNTKKLIKFNLTDEDQKAGENFLYQIGIPKNSWYVCLHVRERNRFEEKQTNDGMRNSNPYNYLKAVDTIINRGGYVIRIGGKNAKKMPKKKNFIDYAHMEKKTEQIDIFLLSTCKFMIATSSGPQRIPSSFGVPVIFTNNTLLAPYFSLKSEDLYLPRLIKNKSGLNLSLDQMTSFPAALYRSEKMFKKAGLYVEENSPDDIDETISEMLMRIENKNFNLTKNQLQFKKIVEKNINSIDEESKGYAACSEYFLNKNNLISL